LFGEAAIPHPPGIRLRAPNCVVISEERREAPMFIVKVSWDARNQQFRLMDQKLAHMFEDGDMYLLVVDFFPQDFDADEQFIDLDQADIGHA
jgi:hypothetical protein